MVGQILKHRNSISYLLLGWVLVLAGGQSIANDAVQPDRVAEVADLLRGYEWQLDAEKMASMPADSYQTLIAISTDSARPPYIRSRADTALSHYANDVVWQHFNASLVQADAVAQRRLLEIICHTFQNARPQAVEVLASGYLESENAHMRIIAANCLKTIGSASALEKVMHHRADSADTIQPWEREALN